MIVPIFFIGGGIALGCALGLGLVSILDSFCEWQESRQGND